MRFALLIVLLVGLTSNADGQARMSEAMREGVSPDGGVVLPEGFYLENVAPGPPFFSPVAVAALPDGRLLVAEKRGVVAVVQGGVRLPTPFLDIQDEVLDHADRGLLGLALDPDYSSNGRIYLHYAVDHDGRGDIDRFDAFVRVTSYAASATDPNVADLSTRRVLIGETFETGIPACFYSHTGGHLAFGTDGTLLIATGDAASYNVEDAGGLYPACFGAGRLDPSEDIGAFRSLRVESLAGKILRVDPVTGEGLPSNPFFTGNGEDNASRVWAMGLRNPFRFAVRDNGNANPADGRPGSLFIGDFGWVTWEEQQVATGGENFAWPCHEGPEEHAGYQAATPGTNGCATMPPRTDPQYYWNHDAPEISNPPGLIGYGALGGAFYQGTAYPEAYRDAYFYADFTFGWMAFAHVGADDLFLDQTIFGENLAFPVQISYDPYRQHLLVIRIAEGRIDRIGYDHPATNEPPIAISTATPSQGIAPLTVAFEGGDSFDPEGLPLTHFWTLGDGRTSGESSFEHVYSDPGAYTATLTVTDPGGLAGTADLTILVGAGTGAPQAAIISPGADAAPAPGEIVVLEALASDPDQSASTLAYHWSVSLVHNGHEHPSFLESDEPTTTFTIPEHGALGEVVFYHVYLTVADDEGLTSEVDRAFRVRILDERDVTSLGTPITLMSQLPGASLDGIEVIHDGVFPPVGSESSDLQFDTYTDPEGSGRTEDWIGYAFPEPLLFSRLTFQEGHHFADGGWFESLQVHVRVAGEWVEAPFLSSFPSYGANDGINYTTHNLVFRAVEGDAIRIHGMPGGSARFISVGELRVHTLTPLIAPEPRPPALVIESIFPNPSSERVSIRIAIPEAADYFVEVYDVLGRRIIRQAISNGEPGTREIDVDFREFPSGLYLARVAGPGNAASPTHTISLLRR